MTDAHVRPPAVAGQFYPGARERLQAELDRCIPANQSPVKALGLVVPHAGYVYSGRTAGAAYARVRIPDLVVVLAPNHTGLGRPVAVWDRGAWETPLGRMAVDEEMAAALLRACSAAQADELAHLREHSLEVQLPFIQRLNPAARLLPVCVAAREERVLRSLGEALAGAVRDRGREALVVASTDMSHYEPADEARSRDELAIRRLEALDPEGLLAVVRREGITMCGAAPCAAMLWAVKALGARRCELADYTHSGMVSGDNSQVVGYAALVAS